VGGGAKPLCTEVGGSRNRRSSEKREVGLEDEDFESREVKASKDAGEKNGNLGPVINRRNKFFLNRGREPPLD